MNWPDFIGSLRQIWDNKPGAVVLLLLGFIIFVFVAADAWWLKRRRGRRHPRKH